ncbi:hypothetical protein MASR2M15_20580 [Anaerolineales bacterium]
MESGFLFFLAALVAIACAVGMLLSKNAVHSVLLLIANFSAVAFLFLMLDAAFLAMVQIVVYAGAIMVLFLFVIMLLGADRPSATNRSFRWIAGAVMVLAAIFLFIVGYPLYTSTFRLPDYQAPGHLRVLNVMPAEADGNGSLAQRNLLVSVSGTDTNVDLGNLSFGDVSDYTLLPPGDYNIVAKLADLDAVIFSEPVTIESNEYQTAIASGLILDGSQKLALLSDDVSPVRNGNARVTFVNNFFDEPVSLVDIGDNRVLDLSKRDVVLTNDEGETILDAAGNPSTIQEDYIVDTVYVSDVEPGASAVFTTPKGAFNYVIVDQSFKNALQDGRVFRDVVVRSGESYLWVLGPETALSENNGIARAFMTTELQSASVAPFGSPKAIGNILFIQYLLPVMVVGMLLLSALVGVIVLHRPDGRTRDRKIIRRKVSRPLVSVVADQTGGDVLTGRRQLDQPESSGD